MTLKRLVCTTSSYCLSSSIEGTASFLGYSSSGWLSLEYILEKISSGYDILYQMNIYLLHVYEDIVLVSYQSLSYRWSTRSLRSVVSYNRKIFYTIILNPPH